MKLIKKNFIFENNDEIKEFIKLLKTMKNCKVSYWRGLPNGYGLHNGKPSILDYNAGYTKSSLLIKPKQ